MITSSLLKIVIGLQHRISFKYAGILPLFGCLAFGDNYTSVASNGTLRVLSYNIHHCVGMDGKLDLERIARVIKSASPDIVALQEVDNKVSRSKKVDQAKEIAHILKMNYKFAPAIKFGGGQYGNAILTKFSIEDSKTVALPGNEKRCALWVSLKDTDNPNTTEFAFIATHLALDQKSQLESVPLIERMVTSRALPTILAGDFNSTPESLTAQAFNNNWQNATDSARFLTCPSENPTQQIDYIRYQLPDNFTVMETKVLNNSVASDHRAILAIFRYKPTSGKSH